MSTVKGVIFEPATEARERALMFMRHHIEAGGRVIFGTEVPMEIGVSFGKADDMRLVVTRRATRDEFIANAPGGGWIAAPPRAPFYWEAGLSA